MKREEFENESSDEAADRCWIVEQQPSKQRLFALGKLVITPGALALLDKSGVNAADLLNRHVRGDWGQLCLEDQRLNDEAVENGDRVLSSYEVGDGIVWAISEADRSSTCLLLPEEY